MAPSAEGTAGHAPVDQNQRIPCGGHVLNQVRPEFAFDPDRQIIQGKDECDVIIREPDRSPEFDAWNEGAPA